MSHVLQLMSYSNVLSLGRLKSVAVTNDCKKYVHIYIILAFIPSAMRWSEFLQFWVWAIRICQYSSTKGTNK